MESDAIDSHEQQLGMVKEVLQREVCRKGRGIGVADLEKRTRAMKGGVVCYGHGGLENFKNSGCRFDFQLPKSRLK
jgi:hypothetical protein